MQGSSGQQAWLHRRPACVAAAAAFCSPLADRLASLAGGGGDGTAVISLKWCAEAMRFLRAMQAELLAAVNKSVVPVSAFGAEDDWFELYMQETAAVLDVCNALKSAAYRFNRYCMMLAFFVSASCPSLDAGIADALPSTSTSSTADVADKHIAVNLAAEIDTLGRKIRGKSKEKSAVAAVLISKITMIAVSSTLISALVSSPAPSAAAPQQLTSKIPELSPWCESLSLINCRCAAAAPSLAEHDAVAVIVRHLTDGSSSNSGEEALVQCLQELRASSDELKISVDLFDAEVDAVFDEVIRGRNQMLAIFSAAALS